MGKKMYRETKNIAILGALTLIITIAVMVLTAYVFGISRYNTIIGTVSLMLGEISIIITVLIYKNQEIEMDFRERPIIEITSGRWYMFYRSKKDLKEGIFRKENTKGEVVDFSGEIVNRGVRDIYEIDLTYKVEIDLEELKNTIKEINKILKPLRLEMKGYGEDKYRIEAREVNRSKYGDVIREKFMGNIEFPYKGVFKYREVFTGEEQKRITLPKELNVIWLIRGSYDSLEINKSNKIQEKRYIVASYKEDLLDIKNNKKSKGENYYETEEGFKTLGFDEMYEGSNLRKEIADKYEEEMVKEVAKIEDEIKKIEKEKREIEGTYIKNKEDIIKYMDRSVSIYMEMKYTDDMGKYKYDKYEVKGEGYLLGDLNQGLEYNIEFKKIREYENEL